MSNSRFRTSMAGFTTDIDILEDLAKKPGVPPNAKKSDDWHWSAAEAQYVTATREAADDYWDIVKDNRNCPPEVKDEYKILINDFMAYDHGKSNPHHLLDKISDFGSISDCETVHVKGGTPLAKTPVKGGGTVVNEIPNVWIIKNEEGKQMIGVTNPETPDSKALPKGIKFAKVLCFIGEKAPTNLNAFTEIGNAKRGQYLNKLIEGELSGSVKLYAWYYALYENTKGVKGKPSIIVKAQVILASV
jgi:hypothetical protein